MEVETGSGADAVTPLVAAERADAGSGAEAAAHSKLPSDNHVESGKGSKQEPSPNNEYDMILNKATASKLTSSTEPDYTIITSLQDVNNKLQTIQLKKTIDENEYQGIVNNFLEIIKKSEDTEILKLNPALERGEIKIQDLLDLIKHRYPNLMQLTENTYDDYIKKEVQKLQQDKDNRSPDQKVNDFLQTIKENTYGDPKLPAAIILLSIFNITKHVLNDEQSTMDTIVDTIHGVDLGSGLFEQFGENVVDLIGNMLDHGGNLVMIISEIFHSTVTILSPTGLIGFGVIKLLLFAVPEIINYINGDDKTTLSESDLLNEYVNKIAELEKTEINENKYIASMLVMLTHFPSLTREKINLEELKSYSKNIEKIIKIISSMEQEDIIDILLDYYVISYTMINKAKGNIQMQKNKILKNTGLFYFMLTRNKNKPFKEIFSEEENKIKLVEKFDNFIFDLTVNCFSLMSGVTNKSNKANIKKYIEISKEKIDDDEKAEKILKQLLLNIENNLKFGSSKTISLFIYYLKKDIKTQQQLLDSFFDQFHENIINNHIKEKIKPDFNLKIIDILENYANEEKKSIEKLKSSHKLLESITKQSTIVKKLDSTENIEENTDLIQDINNYYNTTFRNFITYNDAKTTILGWSPVGVTDEPFTEAIREFKIFLNNEKLCNKKSLGEIVYKSSNIKITKTLFREKLLQYLVLFIYKLNLSEYNNNNFKYYRIPQIYQKNICNTEDENYNFMDNITLLHSVKSPVQPEKLNTKINNYNLILNKLKFMANTDNNYIYYNINNTSIFPILYNSEINFKTGQYTKIITSLEHAIVNKSENIDEEYKKIIDEFMNTEEKKFLDKFTIIRFDKINNVEELKEDESIMLNLESSVIGFQKLIDHVKHINKNILEKNKDKKYVDLMFPNEYFQDDVNSGEVNKEYNKFSYTYLKDNTTKYENWHKYYTDSDSNFTQIIFTGKRLGKGDIFKYIRKYTLKVSDEDSYNTFGFKKFKHVLTPYHYFKYGDDGTYFKPKILDENNLLTYFSNTYLEGGKEVKDLVDSIISGGSIFLVPMLLGTAPLTLVGSFGLLGAIGSAFEQENILETITAATMDVNNLNIHTITREQAIQYSKDAVFTTLTDEQQRIVVQQLLHDNSELSQAVFEVIVRENLLSKLDAKDLQNLPLDDITITYENFKKISPETLKELHELNNTKFQTLIENIIQETPEATFDKNILKLIDPAKAFNILQENNQSTLSPETIEILRTKIFNSIVHHGNTDKLTSAMIDDNFMTNLDFSDTQKALIQEQFTREQTLADTAAAAPADAAAATNTTLETKYFDSPTSADNFLRLSLTDRKDLIDLFMSENRALPDYMIKRLHEFNDDDFINKVLTHRAYFNQSMYLQYMIQTIITNKPDLINHINEDLLINRIDSLHMNHIIQTIITNKPNLLHDSRMMNLLLDQLDTKNINNIIQEIITTQPNLIEYISSEQLKKLDHTHIMNIFNTDGVNFYHKVSTDPDVTLGKKLADQLYLYISNHRPANLIMGLFPTKISNDDIPTESWKYLSSDQKDQLNSWGYDPPQVTAADPSPAAADPSPATDPSPAAVASSPATVNEAFKQAAQDNIKSTGIELGLGLADDIVKKVKVNQSGGGMVEVLKNVSLSIGKNIVVGSVGNKIILQFNKLSADEKKKIQESYSNLDTILHKTNRFINTNFEDIRQNNLLRLLDDNKEDLKGGKKRKKIKTVRKYKYIKNKTGKKRKKSEKIKIIKKNKNKMKISQAIIKHL